MRRLICLLLTLMFLPVFSAAAEGAALGIDTPAEAIRPGKAFLLSFSVPQDGLCDLVLRDVAGAPVMDVVTGLSVSAGSNRLWWNGTSGGVSAAEGVYQLVLCMAGQEAACTVVVGSHAPYLTSITPQMDAETHTMTVDFYASVEGLLSVGLWSGNVWALLENQQVAAGMNQIVWQAQDMPENTTALTLTLTDSTGFSSNEEHISVSAEDLGVVFMTATPAPTEAATPVPTEVVLTPIPAAATPTAAPAEAPADEWDLSIDIDHEDAAEASEQPSVLSEVVAITGLAPTPTPATPADIVFTPSYGSAYPLTEKDEGTYWGTPMDITDEEAIWEMLSAPFTYYDYAYTGQRKIYAEMDDQSRTVGVITGESQGVRVIEEYDNGWSLIETYSSTFHDNSVDAWNMLVQGYVKTKRLKTREVNDKYHIIVDKLTQRLYLFSEEGLVTTLMVSTGLSNERQPYNETRSGEFLYVSPTGGFWSDNMFAPMGMKFNDGDLLHEVPYVQRSGSNTKIYTTTEPFLGQRASHGCIRVQRKMNTEGYNMEWIWDNRKDIGRIVVWEDWQGRQIPYPAEDLTLYYNANGGTYYHRADSCYSADNDVTFAAFTYAELDTEPYAGLEFCPYCAPAMRKAEIDKVNQAHAWGGDHDPILTQARIKWLDKVIDEYGEDALKACELRYYHPVSEE